MNYICQVDFLSDVGTKINTRIYFLINSFRIFIQLWKGILKLSSFDYIIEMIF